MAYSQRFVLLRAHGGFGAATGSAEGWSVGWKIQAPGPVITQAALTAFLSALAGNVIGSYHQSPTIQAGNQTFLNFLTAAYVGTDGKYVSGALQETTRYDYSTPVAGGGTPLHPWMIARAISMQTALGRGPGHQGRFYYPALAAPVTATTGQTPAIDALALAEASANMIKGINDAAAAHVPGTDKVSVMSNKGAGVSATVILVRVGRVLDRQARRQNDVPEAYQSFAVPGTAQLLADRDETPIEDLAEWHADR